MNNLLQGAISINIIHTENTFQPCTGILKDFYLYVLGYSLPSCLKLVLQLMAMYIFLKSQTIEKSTNNIVSENRYHIHVDFFIYAFTILPILIIFRGTVIKTMPLRHRSIQFAKSLLITHLCKAVCLALRLIKE